MSPRPARGKKRAQPTLATKQAALILLGYQSQGRFAAPQTNPSTHQPWTQDQIASKYEVSRTAVVAWKKNATRIFEADQSSRKSRKMMRMREGRFPELERALKSYVFDRVVYLKGESIFRAPIVLEAARNIQVTMLQDLSDQLSNSMSQEKSTLIKEKIQNLETFKGSDQWVSSFMRRNKLHSRKGLGQEGFMNVDTIEKARDEIRKKLYDTPVQNIINTDEVALLYRSFPSRAIRPSDQPARFTRVKDRLTAILSVFADGKKAPLTIIGTAQRPRSFPRHLDAYKDLGIFYYNQKNAWNTQAIWACMMKGFDKASRRGDRKLKLIIDNCSAHSIDYSEAHNLDVMFLPPNMTASLQPVDAAIGRSFKCAYRRLLIKHILQWVNKEMEKPEAERMPFKMHVVVSTYVAVRLMAQAWDLVPTSVVINGWLKTGILVPYQIEDLKNMKAEVANHITPASLIQIGTPTSTERSLNIFQCSRARQLGEKWFENDGTTGNPETVDDLWNNDNIQALHEAAAEIGDLDDLPLIDVNAMERLYEEEESGPTSEPVDAETAVRVAVGRGLEDLYDSVDFNNSIDEDAPNNTVADSGGNDGPRFNVKRFIEAAEELKRQVQLAQDQNHELSKELRADLLGVLNVEIGKAETMQRACLRQTRVDAFFESSGQR